MNMQSTITRMVFGANGRFSCPGQAFGLPRLFSRFSCPGQASGLPRLFLAISMLIGAAVMTVVSAAPSQATWWGRNGTGPHYTKEAGCLSWYGGTLDNYRYFRLGRMGKRDGYRCRKDTNFRYEGFTYPKCLAVNGVPRYKDLLAGDGCSYVAPVAPDDVGTANVCKDTPRTSCDRARGNPTRIANGNKLESVVDYAGGRDGRLTFARTYNSRVGTEKIGLGHMWRSTIDARIMEEWWHNHHISLVHVYHASGRRETFRDVGHIFLPSGKRVELWSPLSNRVVLGSIRLRREP